MHNIWMLSPVTSASYGTYPTCSAYTTGWQMPMYPSDATGQGLAYCQCTDEQIAAAKVDPDITVLPLYQAALPAAVITAYTTHGATAGMSLAALLKLLGAIEPRFINLDPNVSTLISLGLI